MAQAKRDENRVPTLIAVSSADSSTPLVIEGDATTAGLNINIVGDDVGIGGGTQYTEGDTDATITGTAVMWEDGSDTLRSVSSAKPLPISVASLPLPSSAATSAKQLADGHAVTIDNISTNEVFIRGGGTAGSATDGEVVAVQGIASGTAMAVTESSPISGFATSTNQLADGHAVTIDNIISNEVYVRGSGTAGSADAAVLTIQGIASGTNIQVIGTIVATSDSVPDLDGTNLLGTHALLSARSDVNTTVGITAEDSTHNALHVAISDGEGIANVDASNQLAVADAPLAVLVGEVQASPTANTVLARLKTIGDGQLAAGHDVTIDNIITNEVFVRGGGTAGSPQAGEVLAVQGISSGTAMAVTESSPISGFATSTGQLADGHAVTIDNISSNEVFVRGSQSAGSPVDGEVVTVQGIAGADAVTVGGTIAATNTSLIGPGDPTIDSYTQFAINLNAGANQVLVSSAANKQIWVYGFGFTVSVAGTVSFQDELDAALTGIMDFAANSGMSQAPSGNFAMPIWKLGTDKDLEVDIVTAALDGWISYAIVSV